MKQAIYGLILLVFMALPPVITLTESIMTIHMHMQMPLLAVAGMLMTPLLQKMFPGLFANWNKNGVPGILMVFLIVIFWLIPRTMDEALEEPMMEIFKFISWPFLVGVPLRDSWRKLTDLKKNVIYVSFVIMYGLIGWLYIATPDQLCNNYLIVDQRTLGWSFLLIAFCMLLFFIQLLFIDKSDYE